MEGTFLGWVKGKPFGFIVPDEAAAGDASLNVFLHQNTAPFSDSLRRGTRLRFDVLESEKGRAASNVSLIARADAIPEGATRERGRVSTWNARGFGFIEPAKPGSTVFAHQSALPPEENGYLCEGDIVEYFIVKGEKGNNAAHLTVIGWEAGDEHLSAFADMGPPNWADKLAELAEDEPWEYRHSAAPEPLPILRSFIRYTLQRLQETGGIAESPNGKYAAFNTGLVTENQEEIYAMFSANQRVDRQRWALHGFRKASDWDFLENFGASPPKLATYFGDPSVLLYDRRCELYINIDHVLENIERFPAHLRANKYVARQLLISAEATTKKRVYRNYKAAIPQFYRDKGGDGVVQLLLPICLENPAKADLALVVSRNEDGTAYRGSTVLTLDMAYNNARLLTRPDTEWLQP